MKLKGIDVSGYNKITDYTAVQKAGVQFAIIKVIRKDLAPDKLFETHWTGFENAGIPIEGVYNYTYATTAKKAQTDAQRVIDVLAGRHTRVWLDVEDATLKGLGHTLIDIINAYAAVIRSAGLDFGVYTYLSFWNECLKRYSAELDFPFWIARYPSTAQIDVSASPLSSGCPNIGKVLHGWQYSSKGVVKGIIGNVDLDEWYVDIEARDVKHTASDYTLADFRRDMAVSVGLPEFSTAKQILPRTVTINSNKNRHHASVTALERLMIAKGYYSGEVEADHGKKPNFGAGMAKATALFQSEIVGLKKPDKEWTGKTGKSYKKALGLL